MNMVPSSLTKIPCMCNCLKHPVSGAAQQILYSLSEKMGPCSYFTTPYAGTQPSKPFAGSTASAPFKNSQRPRIPFNGYGEMWGVLSPKRKNVAGVDSLVVVNDSGGDLIPNNEWQNTSGQSSWIVGGLIKGTAKCKEKRMYCSFPGYRGDCG